jgi:hypothetical protein
MSLANCYMLRRRCGFRRLVVTFLCVTVLSQAQQGALKKSLKFMQKYWHKGAYYQTGADDEFQESKAREEGVEEVYARDYSAPTGEDKFDKSILPKVMQVLCSDWPATRSPFTFCWNQIATRTEMTLF